MARRSRALLAVMLASSCGDTRHDTPAQALPPLVRPADPAPVTSVTIAGSVIDQANGRGVGHVEVVLRGDDGEVTARTNDSGQFSVTAVPGLYRAFVRGEGVLSVGLAERTRLDDLPRPELAGKLDESLLPVLDARADLAGIELPVAAAATVTGTVLDPARRALAGAVVRLVPMDRFSFANVRPVLGTDIAVTDANGRFTLRVPAGAYLLDATHAD